MGDQSAVYQIDNPLSLQVDISSAAPASSIPARQPAMDAVNDDARMRFSPPDGLSSPSPSSSIAMKSPPGSHVHTPMSVSMAPSPALSSSGLQGVRGANRMDAMPAHNRQADSDLLQLPAELLHKVLVELGSSDPSALATVAAVCHDLHEFVYYNPDRALWRNVLLKRYDDPRAAGAFLRRENKDINWQQRVQDRALLEKVFGTSSRGPSLLTTPATIVAAAAAMREMEATADGAGSPRASGSGGGGGGERSNNLDQRQGRENIITDLQTSRLDRICDALLELYLDLPARDPSTEDTGPQSFFAAPPTRNGPLLNRALRSESFNRMYFELLTRDEPQPEGPVSGRTRSNTDRPDDASSPASLSEESPVDAVAPPNYLAPHARPLPPSQFFPRKNRNRVSGNPTLARLHALVPAELAPNVEQHRQHRGYLRELVYSRRHYRPENEWAPLNPDGTVDWHLLNAIGTVMMLNAIDVLALGEEHWRPAVAPMSNGIEAVRGLGFSNLTRPPDIQEDEVWDWAGAGGQWFGSYAFLDYSDWVILNEPHLLAARHGRIRDLDLSRYLEAVGDLMELDVTATHNPEAASAAYSEIKGARVVLPVLETELPTSSLLPPVYFYGRSQQQANIMHGGAASFVRGVARLTPDNPPEVRWTLVIRYAGEDRWKLEGVQVGGRGSRRGFFGIWTDASKDAHSPNGPVWYWKKESPTRIGNGEGVEVMGPPVSVATPMVTTSTTFAAA